VHTHRGWGSFEKGEPLIPKHWYLGDAKTGRPVDLSVGKQLRGREFGRNRKKKEVAQRGKPEVDVWT